MSKKSAAVITDIASPQVGSFGPYDGPTLRFVIVVVLIVHMLASGCVMGLAFWGATLPGEAWGRLAGAMDAFKAVLAGSATALVGLLGWHLFNARRKTPDRSGPTS